jgi:hypothetical protein
MIGAGRLSNVDSGMKKLQSEMEPFYWQNNLFTAFQLNTQILSSFPVFTSAFFQQLQRYTEYFYK